MVAVRDLEIRHLLALAAVADTGTFGRAATHLGYTQSAISQQVGALESVLGQPVFDRPGGPRPVELTPLGELVLDHARVVLEQVGQAASDIERFRAGAIGRIDIGTFQSVLTALAPAILGRLREERPDVEVRLVQEEDHDVLVEHAIEGSVDVTFLLHDDDRMESVELVVDPFVLVARPDDLGAASRAANCIDPRILHGAPTIAELHNPCQQQIDRGLLDLGIVPEVVFRTNDNTAVTAMVRAGMGMAVMPLLAVDPSDERLAVLTLDPAIPPRHISIGWPRGRTLAPASARFVALAREVTQPLRDRTLAVAG